MEYPDIAQKIKELRNKRKLSIQELAAKTHLTSGYLSKIENSETPPPIPTLSKIAYALNVHISYFFDDDNSPETGISIVRNDERKEVVGDLTQAGYKYESVIHRQFDNMLNAFVVTLPEDVDPHNILYNTHEGEELIYVLEGNTTFYYGNDEYAATQGDSLYFKGSIPHRIVQATQKKATKILSILFLGSRRT